MTSQPLVPFVKRHAGAIAIVVGFVWDSFTLGRPDQLFNNIVFISYLSVAAFAIILLAIYERKKGGAPLFLLPLMQFSFGNLAGGLLVVYGKSGTFSGSILFFLILIAFVVGNEFAKGYYQQLSFHLAAWYFLLFGYLAIQRLFA